MISEHTRKIVGYLNRRIDLEWKVWQLLDRDMANGISMSSIIRAALIRHYANQDDPKDYNTIATLADMAQKLAEDNKTLRANVGWLEQENERLRRLLESVAKDARAYKQLQDHVKKQKDQRGN